MDSNNDDNLFEPEPPGYVRLTTPRRVDRPDLPRDVAEFYTLNEGVGTESELGGVIRLCQLEEVTRIRWADLHILGETNPPHAGWASFEGFRLGYSDSLDEIAYVLEAPGIPKGAVLAMGESANLVGPGGSDVNGPCATIVLAQSFGQWIDRMEKVGANAHGLFVDMDLPDEAAVALREELAALNPHSDYAK